jgi:gliding motility-associated-like protein
VSLSGDGTYTLGLSVNGCYYNYTAQPIVVDTAINLTVTGNLVCSGKTATLVANGASNYTWTPTGLNTSSILVAPNTTTVFSLTTTKNSCSTSTVITILVTPTPTLTVNNPVICQGDTATLNVSGAASYVWLPANITGSTYTTSPTSSQIILVTGSNGPCSSASSCTIQVNPLPTDDFIFDLSQAECNAKLTFNLVSGGIPAYTYTLDFGDGSNSIITNSIDHQYQTGVYQTTLTIAQNDCINYVIKPIVINALDSTVIIPNTFSPNNDKINDSYFIKANCITEFELLIFNRWGKLVFKTNDILEKWNGTMDKDNVPDGVYSYILNYKKVNQTISTKKTGHITIFR